MSLEYVRGEMREEIIRNLKERFPQGTRVELISMNDPYTTLKAGEKGTVTFVDDIGTIHVKWDSGSSLGLVFGEDQAKIINE